MHPSLTVKTLEAARLGRRLTILNVQMPVCIMQLTEAEIGVVCCLPLACECAIPNGKEERYHGASVLNYLNRRILQQNCPEMFFLYIALQRYCRAF